MNSFLHCKPFFKKNYLYEECLVLNMNSTRFQFFLSKHYEFLQQLGLLFTVTAMMLVLYLTFNGLEL